MLVQFLAADSDRCAVVASLLAPEMRPPSDDSVLSRRCSVPYNLLQATGHDDTLAIDDESAEECGTP